MQNAAPSPAHPQRLFFSVPEVAQRIGRSELATRRAIERGHLPARRWGRRVVVLADDLETFVRALPRLGDPS
jgi:excisionase family DNA binding protein